MKSIPVVVSFLLSFLVISTGFVNNQSFEISDNKSVVIMSYNIHHARGMDGEVNVERIAEVIIDQNADILALQEVDVGVERSGNIDIANKLAELTGLEYVIFGKNLDHQGGEYGNATLSRYPITEYKNVHFEQMGPELRGILTAIIKIGEYKLLMLNTHLDHREDDDSERLLYIHGAKDKIIPEYKNADGTIFIGDINDVPGSSAYNLLTNFLSDAWEISGEGKGYTHPSDTPQKRIDYIFFKGLLRTVTSRVPETDVSDHLPVVSEFELIIEE